MSVPDTMTMKDVSGSYSMEKDLSDPINDFMELQGVPFLIRKAIGVVPISMKIEHDSAANPPTLTFTMGGAGPFKPNVTVTTLDNVPSERDHPMMGHLKAWGQVLNVAEIDDVYLKEGWCEDSVIEQHEENAKDGWKSISYFGLQEVEGKRYYCRKSRITDKKGQTAQVRFVNGYKGLV